MPEAPLRTDLILQGSIATQPATFVGTLEGGELTELAGSVNLNIKLSAVLEKLGEGYKDPADALKELFDADVNADVELQRVGLSYRRPKSGTASVQAGLIVKRGNSSVQLALLKVMDGRAGFIAGIDLRSDGAALPGNFLSGLIGDVSIGNLGIYHASAEFPSVSFVGADEFRDGNKLSTISRAANRRFTKGWNFSLAILVGGVDLLEKLNSKKAEKKLQGNSPAPVVEPAKGLSGGSTYWMEVDTTIGPLSIRRIGLSYEKSIAGIKLDAGIQLSVLTASLEGLGLTYPITKIPSSAAEVWKNLGFTLDGASVVFEQGPVTIAGGLLVASRNPLQLDGTLLIRVPGISISAIASYADLKGTFSFFAFAVLLAELGDPTGTGCFLITGLAFGFGMNRALKLPPIEEVHNFPLIKAATDADYLGKKLDLRAISQKLGDCVFPATGQYWVAVGLKFSSYGLIDSFALVSVAFGDELVIGFLGVSILAIPRGGKPGEVIAYAELAMRAVIKPAEGLIAVEARLTAESYIFSKDCHLTGGFAFYVWFSGPLAGDFIVSLGGYHPKFVRPSHYPLVPRLGVNWQVTAELAVVAEFYFTLTASCLMAGGRLSAVYQSSWIKAWFIAYADFLLNWKPFYYTADMSISVGVEVNLAIFSFTVHLSVGLHLWGPEFAGVIEVDLTVLSFTISFGPAKQPPKPLKAKEFVSTFLPPQEQVIATQINSGLVAEQKDGDRVLRVVNAHALALTTQSVVPVSEFTGVTPPAFKPAKLGIRSMGKKSLKSSSKVSLKRGGKEVVQKDVANLRVSVIEANVPDALWGPSEVDGQVKLASVPEAGKMMVKAAAGLRISLDPKYPANPLPAMEMQKFAFANLPEKWIPWDQNLKASDRLDTNDQNGGEITAWMSEEAQKRRNAVHAVLQGSAVLTDLEWMPPFPALDEVKLNNLVRAGAAYFQADPEICRLGEAFV